MLRLWVGTKTIFLAIVHKKMWLFLGSLNLFTLKNNFPKFFFFFLVGFFFFFFFLLVCSPVLFLLFHYFCYIAIYIFPLSFFFFYFFFINSCLICFPFLYIRFFILFFLLYFQYWKWSMVTETFTNKHEIKNPGPHYNCLHKTSLL